MKKIGFIGQGWIGKNYADDFERRGLEVVRYALEEPYVKNKDKINRFQNSTENETRCRKASSKPNGTMSKRKETAESDQSTIDGEVAEAQPETSTRYHPEMKMNTRKERQFCLAPRMYFTEFMY